MSIAALIRRMSDAGAPPEAIALAVEEIEALQVSLQSRRTADRDRKRAQRDRQKSADVTGQSEDILGTVTPSPSSPEVSPQTPLPNPTNPSPLKGSPHGLKRGVGLPEWLSPEPWRAFVAMRSCTARVPFTEEAAKRIVAKLEKLRSEGHDPAKLLDKAIERGWRTVFPDEDTKASLVVVPKTADEQRAWAEGLAADYERLGRPRDAAELRRSWGIPEPPPIDAAMAARTGGLVKQVANRR